MTGKAALTIAVAAESDPVRERIAGWTATGMLRPSVWLAPAELTANGPDVMDTMVWVVRPSGRTELPLRDVFGDGRYRTVRLLLVRPGDTPETVSPSDAWAFADRLRPKLARGTELIRINLLVPSGRSPGVRELIEEECDLNVLVSPEDRPSEDAVDHGVDREGAFVAHAALACATVGALWTHAEIGAFDGTDRPTDGRAGRILASRSSARVVDATRLPTLIVARLFRSGLRSLSQYLPENSHPVVNDGELVAEAFESFRHVQDNVLWYRPKVPTVELPQRRLGVQTLGMLLRFLLHFIRVHLIQWRNLVASKLDQKAEEWLHRVTSGESSISLPMFVPAMPDELVNAAAAAPRSLRRNPRAPRTLPIVPLLWPLVRQLCFGLLDGGPMPEEVRAKWGELNSTVSDPTWIVASPDGRFALTGEEVKLLADRNMPHHDLRPGDSATAARLDRDLAELLATTKPGPATDNTRAVFRDCHTRLRAWLEGDKSDQSLIGRLCEHVDAQVRRASDDLLRRREQYDEQDRAREKVLGKLANIRGRLGLHLLVLGVPLGVGIIALIVGLLSGFAGAAGSSAFWGTIACAIAVGVELIVLADLANTAAALEYQLQLVECHRSATIATIQEWPEEAQRLGTLYAILLDWAEIIGWMLYEPLTDGIESTGNPDTSAGRTPEALRLGRPSELREDIMMVTADVAADVFTAGWISRLYQSVLDVAVPERGTEDTPPNAHTDPDYAPGPPVLPETDDTDANADANADGPAEQPEPEPEADDLDRRPSHARERLLGAFRNRDCADTALLTLSESVRRGLKKLPIEQLMSIVNVTSSVPNAATTRTLKSRDFLTEILPSHDHGCLQFTPGIFSATGLTEGRAAVESVHLWSSTPQLTGDLSVASASLKVAEYPVEAQEADQPFYVSLVRLDTSAECEPQDLAPRD